MESAWWGRHLLPSQWIVLLGVAQLELCFRFSLELAGALVFLLQARWFGLRSSESQELRVLQPLLLGLARLGRSAKGHWTLPVVEWSLLSFWGHDWCWMTRAFSSSSTSSLYCLTGFFLVLLEDSYFCQIFSRFLLNLASVETPSWLALLQERYAAYSQRR